MNDREYKTKENERVKKDKKELEKMQTKTKTENKRIKKIKKGMNKTFCGECGKEYSKIDMTYDIKRKKYYCKRCFKI